MWHRSSCFWWFHRFGFCSTPQCFKFNLAFITLATWWQLNNLQMTDMQYFLIWKTEQDCRREWVKSKTCDKLEPVPPLPPRPWLRGSLPASVTWCHTTPRLAVWSPVFPTNLHAEVSLSKMLNPELCLIELLSAANRCTVWMCVWLGECKTVL